MTTARRRSERALPNDPPISREHLRRDHLPVYADQRGWRDNHAPPGRSGTRASVFAKPHPTGGFSPVMTCLRGGEARAAVRARDGTVGGVRSVPSGRATRFLPMIDLFFSASRILPVRTPQTQARR